IVIKGKERGSDANNYNPSRCNLTNVRSLRKTVTAKDLHHPLVLSNFRSSNYGRRESDLHLESSTGLFFCTRLCEHSVSLLSDLFPLKKNIYIFNSTENYIYIWNIYR